jgi:hypothetical protein
MTITRTPAETLLAAAARLREMAEPMDTRPLTINDEPDGAGGRWWEVYAVDAVDEEEFYRFTRRPDAEWFATMSPSIAEPLARWLDYTASTFDHLGGRLAVNQRNRPLALAIAILGGEPCAS